MPVAGRDVSLARRQSDADHNHREIVLDQHVDEHHVETEAMLKPCSMFSSVGCAPVKVRFLRGSRHGSRRRTRRSDPRGRRRTIAVLRLCETHASIFKRHARSYSCALALLTIAERRA